MTMVFGEVDANLVTRLAGEDLVNDRMKVSSQPDRVVIVSHDLAMTSSQANSSGSYPAGFDCSTYRYWSLRGYGTLASVASVIPQWSFDGGTDWSYEADMGPAQYFARSTAGDVLAPLFRVVVSNGATAQTVKIYACFWR